MQYSIVNYKTVKGKEDFRWDGEFLCFEPRKNSQYEYAQIGDVLKFAQYGISIDMNEEGRGYKIYRMNEISNMFCDLDIDKYADIDEKEMKKFVLKNNDVLFNRTNSQIFVGRTGIFKKFSNESLIFASYLVRFRPDTEKILSEYLTSFLNTKYGVQDVKRRARISINQSNVSSSELQKVEIPLLSIIFQSKLKPLFDKSFQLILDSKTLYFQAEQLLLSELGLLGWKPKRELAFVKKFSATRQAERFDAEYFQPKYEEIIKAIKKYRGGFDKLENLTKLVGHPSNPPYETGNTENKTFIITQKHLANYFPVDNFWKDEEALYTTDEFIEKNKKFILQKNDIILYSVGAYIGKANLYNTDIKATIGSFLTLIRPKSEKINPFYLLVFLNSKIGQELTRRNSRGLAQQYIYPYDTKQVIVPILETKAQKEIEKLILEGQKSHNLSKSLLEIAKRGVEMAIEKDEQEAEKWINAELEKLAIKL